MPTLEWIGKEKVINHHQEVPFPFALDRQYSFDENGQHAEEKLIAPKAQEKPPWGVTAVRT